MTAELSITGREHWTQKGPSKLFLWEKAAGASPGPQKNFRIPYHILHSFFSQPAPIYRGAGGPA